MEITRRKNYKHYTYARKQVVPVVELESLMPQDKKSKIPPAELLEQMTINIMSRINFERLGRVCRILSIESDRRIFSTSETERIVYSVVRDALKNFIANKDVGFYDHEAIGVCIFIGKNSKHGLVIYPKLDLPR